MIELIVSYYNYWVCIALMMIGFYAVISTANLMKKLIGLAIFQTSVLLFYISLGNVTNGNVPLLEAGVVSYVNPLPQVLMLTAIVVGVATLSVGLSLVVRIQEQFGTVEEDEIILVDRQHHNRAK